jgi:hypothetical protein
MYKDISPAYTNMNTDYTAPRSKQTLSSSTANCSNRTLQGNRLNNRMNSSAVEDTRRSDHNKTVDFRRSPFLKEKENIPNCESVENRFSKLDEEKK